MGLHGTDIKVGMSITVASAEQLINLDSLLENFNSYISLEVVLDFEDLLRNVRLNKYAYVLSRFPKPRDGKEMGNYQELITTALENHISVIDIETFEDLTKRFEIENPNFRLLQTMAEKNFPLR